MTPIYPLNAENIQKAARFLKDGHVVAHPADTCYGLAAIFGDWLAMENLKMLKGRDAQKPMSVMLPLSHKNQIGMYAKLDEFSKKACQALLPGPVTLLLPKGPNVPDWYFPETDKIGLRIPDDENCQTLLKELNQPIITTSANPSGQPLCQTAEEIQKAFSKQLDFLKMILSASAPLPQTPSTIILLEKREIRIIREGPWNKEKIENLIFMSS